MPGRGRARREATSGLDCDTVIYLRIRCPRHDWGMSGQAEAISFGLAPAAAVEVQTWLGSFAGRRRAAAKTIEAYARDLAQFGRFLQDHLGEPADLEALEGLLAADFRAFLAARRNGGVGSRSLARQLSAIRSFYRDLERRSILRNPAIWSVRSPKLPHLVPRPLPQAEALAMVAEPLDHDGPPWVETRDIAILMLLYGRAGASPRRWD